MEITNRKENKIKISQEVPYDEDKMWFDYQALFNKTKNVVLGKQDDTKVAHIGFDKSNLAHNVISSEKKDEAIDAMLNGEFWAQRKIINIFGHYISCNYPEEKIIYGKESCRNYCILDYNYRYLLGIASSLTELGNMIFMEQYSILSDGIPIDFDSNNILNMNFHDIMVPLLSNCKILQFMD